ncbi:MAG TPA: hypothetical protein VFA98_13530 [Thermoanaerobaculia bacterium]|jgi:hypothetical protein|nr:hypothetical protein [Thermoanaerobaculia bacterium]
MDYAVTPFQPIVQGVVSFVAGAPVFDGEGVADIARAPGFPVGAFLLTLDPGLIGNAGAVPPGASPKNDPNVRTILTMRGVGAPPLSNIVTKAVLYLLSPAPGVGADRILVVTQTFPLALADPNGGFEIIVFVVET